MVCPAPAPEVSTRTLSRPPGPQPQAQATELLYVVLVVTVTDPSTELGEHFQAACTGTLLTHTMVLTGAGCVHVDSYDDFPNPEATTVYQRPNYSSKAVKILLYPKAQTRLVDLSLIGVEGSVGHRFPRVSNSPKKFHNIDLKSCVLAGYGSEGVPNERTFNVINLNKTRSEFVVCRRPLAQRSCIHFEDMMPCGGDMGSPLICGDSLMYVYTPMRDPGSYRTNCVARAGVVFTPMWSVSPWLHAVLEAPDPALQWLNNPWSLLLLSLVILLVTGLLYCCLLELLQHRFNKRSVEESPAPSASVLLPLADPDPDPDLDVDLYSERSSGAPDTSNNNFWTKLWG